MTPEPMVRRAYLQQVAYKDSGKLLDRASIYRYRVAPGELNPWVLAHTDWPAGARVLDVGCGPGRYLRDLAALPHGVRVVGVDLSEGMCREACEHAPVAMADAQVLPFPGGAFDRVLAPHMLYHCPDIPAAVAELRRVLAPGGTALVVLNTPEHMAEARELMRTVLGTDGLSIGERITTANAGPVLAAAFAEVTLDRFDSDIAVPEAAPVVAYVRSTSRWDGVHDPDAATAALAQRVDEVIARDGAFRLSGRAAVYVCR